MHIRDGVALALAVTTAVLIATWWYIGQSFPDVSIETILFYAANGAQGAGSQTIPRALSSGWWVFLLALIPLVGGIFATRFSNSLRQLRARYIPKRLTLIWVYFGMLCTVLILALYSLGAGSYVASRLQTTDLYEKHYVHPDTVMLQFPERKRNLVMIYAESIETTVMSRESGGVWPRSLMPELEQLALDNVNFSNTSQLGGPVRTANTENTTTGLVAQTSGTPLVIGSDININNTFSNYSNYLPGLVSLGDILEREGYAQKFLLGSDANFGNRKTYFKQHGDMEIYDYPAAKAAGDIPKDYFEWWGYEDQKLFGFARDALSELSAREEPFALNLLTVDTHFVDGWLDPSCRNLPYNAQYEKVHACSSSQIAEFVSWIQQQPYYDDTSIVIVGDHLGMQVDFYENRMPADYPRTLFNTYINPAAEPSREKNRSLSSFDTFPTTLASLGVQIDGNRLGFGTNLFSERDTVTEEIGIDALNKEVVKRSSYYQNCIVKDNCN